MAEVCVRGLVDAARAGRREPLQHCLAHEIIVRDSTGKPGPQGR
jgi:hypothetical protein